MPRPSPDAVFRGEGRALSHSSQRHPFDDEADAGEVRRLTPAEAEAFRRNHPPLSPWRVVAAQVALGAVAAVLAGLLAGRASALSALYGAAVVAIPGALMARGATSPLTSLSPLISAVGMLGWAVVKIVAAVAMLVLAPRIVGGLVWPVLLVTMVVCLQTYWFALLWRPRAATRL
ncbi:MAG: ATP synthase subunit I [Caldimonas sp.]